MLLCYGHGCCEKFANQHNIVGMLEHYTHANWTSSKHFDTSYKL